MGIKRTPTGRIYYDAEEGRGDERQQQMVGLLGQLGDRLKRSEEERDEIWKELQEYRKLIADIEDKTANSEKVFLSVQNKLTRTEKLEADLVKRQEQLEKSQKEQFDKLAKAAKSDPEIMKRLDDSAALTTHLLEKLEASDAQQKRLDRKIEKITQDRVRLARKLERLEETVLETQDVLRAKALVLLTDQSIAAQTALPQIPASPLEGPPIEASEAGAVSSIPLWQRVLNPQAIGATAMVVIALLIGWTINEYQSTRTITSAAVAGPGMSLAQVEPAAGAAPAAEKAGRSVLNRLEEQLAGADDGALASSAEPLAVPTAEGLLEDVPVEALESGDYDETALALAMELDPEAVAARLNEIEPSMGDVAGEIEELANDSQATPPEAAVPAKEDVAYAPSVKADAGSADLRTLMAPDAGLPDVVKQIENQAYEGIATAQHDLAAIYTAGHGGVKQNYEKAAFWFRQAAGQGIANARYNLGVLYHQGLGVGQDIDAAIDWYQKAAELDHPEAQYNLGIAFIEGIGVPYDPQKAARYFERAADQNIMEAAYNLGLIHENGLLGEPSPEEALLWYKVAADSGSAEARRAMEQLAKSLKIEPADIDRLVERSRANSAPVSDGDKAAKSDKQAAVTSNSAAVLAREVQGQLVTLGLFPGPVDGVIGQQTSDAIRVYQTRNGLPVDGNVSESLLVHMLGGPEGPGEVGSRAE